MAKSYLFIVCCLWGVFLEKGVASDADSKSASIRLPYYARDLDAPADAVLCLNVGISTTPGHVGHSTVSLFELDKKNSKPGVMKSIEVNSIGYWPKDPEEEHDLRYNYADDHFLKFQNGFYDSKKSETYCVPVTKEESKRMMDFYRKKLAEDKDWTLHFNCNDISRLNFEIATGIHFKTRALKTGFLSHPGTLLKNVEKCTDKEAPAGYFTYSTQKPEEVKMIEAIEAGPNSGRPAYTKEDAAADRKERRRSRPLGGHHRR